MNFNYSKAISSQEELADILSKIATSSDALASRMRYFISIHPEAVPAMKIFSEVCRYTEPAEDGSFPPYNEDSFFSTYQIESQFYKDKFAKRVFNLLELMNSIPASQRPVTYNMIRLVGKTVANRIFEVCNGVDGYRGIMAGMYILDIIRDVFLRIYTSKKHSLVYLFTYGVLQLCVCEKIFVAEPVLYNKVRSVEDDHKVVKLTLDDFPALS